MIRAFVEAPAGLAAVSLRLHGGQHCRPPISRMGNKAGYSAVILAALGLRSGEGAGAYVWAESDPDVRALLRAYPDADMLRRIADIIRGWKDEEPRALWERLRAERKARGPAVDDDAMAGWVVTADLAFRKGEPESGFRDDAAALERSGNDPRRKFAHPSVRCGDGCHRLAEYASIVASNRLIHVAGPELRNTGAGGTTFGGEAFATPAAEVASGFERVAEWALLATWAYRKGQPESGFNPGVATGTPVSETSRGANPRNAGLEADLWRPAASASRWPPVAVLATIPDAATLSAMLGTPGDLEGVVCYMDPPYVGTTGYADDLPRADVVRIALDYHRAGAVVCVSEAVPVEELVAVGWHTADIGAGRKGQRRTFARVATEALTMNREPAHRVATQQRMFGG